MISALISSVKEFIALSLTFYLPQPSCNAYPCTFSLRGGGKKNKRENRKAVSDPVTRGRAYTDALSRMSACFPSMNKNRCKAILQLSEGAIAARVLQLSADQAKALIEKTAKRFEILSPFVQASNHSGAANSQARATGKEATPHAPSSGGAPNLRLCPLRKRL